MAQYPLSFPSVAVVVSDDEWDAVGRGAHAVIDEAKAAGVDVFGGGIDVDVPPVRVCADSVVAMGGLSWAARVAGNGCRLRPSARSRGCGFHAGVLQGVSVTTKEEVAAFLAAEFPQAKCVIREVGQGGCTLSLDVGTEDLRPGGTVSGPALMGLADVALYVAILGEIGIVPLAVTTSLTINFLRKPVSSKTVVAVCKLMKVGRSLAVGEVSLYSEGAAEPVAHVVGTYAIPPRGGDRHAH
jgi:uncharacterized protein (TIGR00369 family)